MRHPQSAVRDGCWINPVQISPRRIFPSSEIIDWYPRRLPDEAHIGGTDSGNEDDLAAGVFRDGWPMPQPGAVKRHRNIHAIAFGRDLFDFHRINEAEVDDVHRISGSKTFLSWSQIASGSGAASAAIAVCVVGSATCSAEGVRIAPVDAREAVVNDDGVTATQRLGDMNLGSAVSGIRFAAGDLRGGDVATEDAFYCSWGKKLQVTPGGDRLQAGFLRRPPGQIVGGELARDFKVKICLQRSPFQFDSDRIAQGRVEVFVFELLEHLLEKTEDEQLARCRWRDAADSR